jgi:hypothetical protein
MQNITLEQLFYGDRTTLFKINPGDAETLANVSVATIKEMALAINGLHERGQLLYEDLQKAEARIEKLERQSKHADN